jgi:ABC-type multidrug transport system fused ATPase/permease subunit
MVLFNDTIRYNIEYGRLGAGEAEVYAAARRVSQSALPIVCDEY